MKLLLAIFLFFTAFSGPAQTVATTANALRPILKDPNSRNAPTSLNRDPAEKASLQYTQPARPAAAVKPVEIVARIDAGLAVSPITLLGTVSGIKGRLYVTNLGSQTVTPLAQFAVCNQKGSQIASATKTGQALEPNAVEKIEVLATDLNAVDLKLMKLSIARGAK